MRAERTDLDLVRIALVGLAGIAMVLGLAVNVQRLPFVGNGTEYRAEFKDASGLVPGEEVRVAGVKVGTVTGISLRDAKVIVTFRAKGVELGDATSAGIEIKTLLGQHYLSLAPAGRGSLHQGAVIPLSRTTAPVNVVPAFQRLTTQAQQLDTAEVAKAFDVLATTLRHTAPEVTQTLRGLSRISESITSRDDQIQELLARTSDISGVVAERDQDIATLLTDTNIVLAELDRRRETVRGIIDGTQALAQQISRLVRDNKGTLAPALAKLNGVLAVLEKNKANLDQAIRVANVYGREFVNVGGNGHWFDGTLNLPHGLAACATDGTPPGLGNLLGPILSQLNGAINDSNRPCLPLGPAAATP